MAKTYSVTLARKTFAPNTFVKMAETPYLPAIFGDVVDNPTDGVYVIRNIADEQCVTAHADELTDFALV